MKSCRWGMSGRGDVEGWIEECDDGLRSAMMDRCRLEAPSGFCNQTKEKEG